jgi:hypothetical protein
MQKKEVKSYARLEDRREAVAESPIFQLQLAIVRTIIGYLSANAEMGLYLTENIYMFSI